jgi:CDK-activating kinase assembly factor MAT1
VVLKKGNLQRKAQQNTHTNTAAHAKAKAEKDSNNNNTTDQSSTSTAQPPDQDVPTGFLFPGLRPRTSPPKPKPFDPYGGYNFAFQYYTLQPEYSVEWMAKPKTDPENIAGGWEISDWYGCAMFDAFSGLGVFVGEEVGEEGREEGGEAEVGTRRAVGAALVKTSLPGDVVMDDVF